MLRLLAFLVTGFWPSHKSLLALGRRVDTLDARLTTLTKKHNTLAGSFYADTEEIETSRQTPGAPIVTRPDTDDQAIAIHPAFPEEEFRQLVEQRRHLTIGAPNA